MEGLLNLIGALRSPAMRRTLGLASILPSRSPRGAVAVLSVTVTPREMLDIVGQNFAFGCHDRHCYRLLASWQSCRSGLPSRRCTCGLRRVHTRPSCILPRFFPLWARMVVLQSQASEPHPCLMARSDGLGQCYAPP